jgi:hypothetical protein
MQVVTKEKTIEHPLEDLFDINPGSTVVEFQEFVPDAPIESSNYDDRDLDIDEKLENIYTVAMSQATVIADEVDMVEGKFKARMGEVASTMLSVALGAVREKRMAKEHKDKLMPSRNIGTINNNTLVVAPDNVVADRNELLRAFLNQHQ